MASLSQALRLGDLPPPHRTFQGHATHIIEWSMMLRPNDSWSTCIPQGIATFLHYASRRSAGYRYTTALPTGLLASLAGTERLGLPPTLGACGLLALLAVQALLQVADGGLMGGHLRLQRGCSL